jgi:hypothetical protein
VRSPSIKPHNGPFMSRTEEEPVRTLGIARAFRSAVCLCEQTFGQSSLQPPFKAIRPDPFWEAKKGAILSEDDPQKCENPLCNGDCKIAHLDCVSLARFEKGEEARFEDLSAWQVFSDSNQPQISARSNCLFELGQAQGLVLERKRPPSGFKTPEEKPRRPESTENDDAPSEHDILSQIPLP